MKYIVKNCPLYYNQNGFNYCRYLYKVDRSIFCEKYTDCLLKRIVSLCKENQFYGYGAIMLENGLSADILDLLEIGEVE